MKSGDSGNIPDPFDVLVKPEYDVYQLKHPSIDRAVDFSVLNKVKKDDILKFLPKISFGIGTLWFCHAVYCHESQGS